MDESELSPITFSPLNFNFIHHLSLIFLSFMHEMKEINEGIQIFSPMPVVHKLLVLFLGLWKKLEKFLLNTNSSTNLKKSVSKIQCILIVK